MTEKSDEFGPCMRRVFHYLEVDEERVNAVVAKERAWNEFRLAVGIAVVSILVGALRVSAGEPLWSWLVLVLAWAALAVYHRREMRKASERHALATARSYEALEAACAPLVTIDLNVGVVQAEASDRLTRAREGEADIIVKEISTKSRGV
jgi:hypothetical protein